MKSRFYIFSLLFTILIASGCVPTHYLAEDEELLVDIKLKDLRHIEPAAIEPLYQQDPNRIILGSAPYLGLYNFGKKFYSPPRIDEKIQKQRNKMAAKIREAGADTVKVRKLRNRYNGRIASLQKRKEEGNFVMQLGEPPAIFDSTLLARTIDQISIFMNANGYFNHEANYEKENKDKLVYITIGIKENEPYRYSQLSYNIPDTAVLNLVKQRSPRSLIKSGAIYNEEVLAAERDRLYEYLRNNGYYDFARAYIYMEVDTSFGGNTVRVSTGIQNPEDGTRHRVYTVKNVYFKTDVDRFGIPRDTVQFNGINYMAYDFKYANKILDQKVEVYPGQNYSALNTAITQRRLADLDVFQFNNVSYTRLKEQADSVSGNLQLNAFINALPSKKFQEIAEIGLNYTVRRPGPFSSVRLRVRNVFGGAENLDIGVRGGFEAQVNIASQEETVMIKELGGDMSLTFPVILFPGRKTILSEFNPRTRLYSGYTLIDRQEFTRSNYEFSLDYIWQQSRRPLQAPTLQYIFSPVNLTIVEADTNNFSAPFKEALNRFRSFKESFRSGIISSMSFNLIYNTNDFAQTRNARYFRALVEVGGLSKELGLNLRINDLQTFQFARINPDYRRYIPLGNKQYFAYRINTGVASPIFRSSVLPYEKYFFAGGTNSMRAWQFRRLGPGSYALYTRVNDNDDDPDNDTFERNFAAEQPGEVLFETSAEYRFNIFSFLNGALFVDAGNIWTLQPDETRPGADFKFNRFYKELAVGTGFGLRFDLTVLVLRFDFATKVYDPAGINGKKYLLGNFRFSDFFKQSNQSSLNIGIGYPF